MYILIVIQIEYAYGHHFKSKLDKALQLFFYPLTHIL